MKTPQTPKHAGRLSERTRLITLASIVVVGLAGATAVSANIGILDAASDSNVGNVSAAGDLTPATQVIDVYLPSTSSTTAAPVSASAGVQVFAVDTAGTVSLISTATGIRLDSVAPAADWTWSLTQTSQTQLMVTMTNGVRTLEFNATTAADGSIVATVNEPIVTQAPPNSTVGNDDHGDDDHGDDDEDEHEGGEDDD